MHSESITPAQLEYLSALASQIKWTTSVHAFIRARLLHPFRRDAWDGALETLTMREAANVITVLRNMLSRERATLGTATARETRCPKEGA